MNFFVPFWFDYDEYGNIIGGIDYRNPIFRWPWQWMNYVNGCSRHG